MKLSLTLLILSLLMLPVAVWAERTYPDFWEERLFARSLEYKPGRKELVHQTGRLIPSNIEEDLTLTPQDNPVILRYPVTINDNATLTIEAGTNIYTHEFTHITVQGELHLKGAKDNKINIFTNHKHESKKNWNGFIFEKGSTSTITHTTIRHGSPAITCLEKSRVTINESRLHMGEAGMYISSQTCTLTNSVIHGVRDGVITTLPNYTLEDNQISSTRKDVVIGK